MRANIVFNVPFWLLLLADACAYFTLKGFVDWALLYLVERKSASEVEATHLLFWSEVGGIVGTFAAGFMSDMVHKYSGKNSRNITSLVFITLSAVTCAMMLYIDPKAAYYEALLCHFFIGFFVNGPKIMCGIAVREVMPPQVSGTAAGILGLVGQVRSSCCIWFD
jgi:sugar phosphate permease